MRKEIKDEISRCSVGVFKVEGSDDSWSQTSQGRRISILNPREEDIYIDDIACAISKQCRYNGSVIDFYSVAQHCILGAWIAQEKFGSKELAKEFLLHDASEAYIGDMIRPLKIHIPIFLEIEERFNTAIANKFGVPAVMSKEIKLIDNIMLAWEKRTLLPNSEVWSGLPEIEEYHLRDIVPWPWETAKNAYLHAFEVLFNEE